VSAAIRQPPLVTLYSRTYLDAEVEVDLASLATGKGKVAAPVRVQPGGFACNGALSFARYLPPESIHVITALNLLDRPRLHAHLPKGVSLDPLTTGVEDWLPISIIINPARECRILRDPHEDDCEPWQIERVSSGALAARLHVLGRLPTSFVADVLEQCRTNQGRLAWCGGADLPLDLERQCDLMCVNTAEASRLLEVSGQTTREMAEALARRAGVDQAVRVVTGRGTSPTVAGLRLGERVRLFESSPIAVEPNRIVRLLGVGDCFAACFLANACFKPNGSERKKLDIDGALEAAQISAGQFIQAINPGIS